MTVATVAAVASATVVASTSAFVFPSRMPSSMTATARIRRPRPGVVVASSMMAVGGGRMPSSSSDGEDRLISSSRRLLLDEAFMNLDDADRYETVLVGLCAKIIDDGTENYAKSGLVDPLRLLGEMNDRGISMGPRGVVGLIDATALSSDVGIMADVLSLSKRNGAIARYGSFQNDVIPVPRSSSPSSSASFAFGGGGVADRERNLRRLASLPPVPIDDRATEVSQAALFGVTIASCVMINFLAGPMHLEDLTTWTNVVIGISLSVLILDNFFDAIVSSTSFVVRMNEDNLPDAIKSSVISDPTTIRKEDMPLGIGTGMVTGSLMRGIGRLLDDDTERDCMCEAASVYAAYVLGLPCFAFRPNAREGADMVLRSMTTNNDERGTSGGGGGGRRMDSLASDAGLMKVLVWLMAPVAMELSKYPQLTSSEPREAYGFLERLDAARRSSSLSLETLADALPADDGERDAYLRWALAEADALLRRNMKAVDALSDALAGGAATVGDCVAILEGW